MKTFFDIAPPDVIAEYKARDEIVTLKNGSRILFRSLDDVDKLRSLNLGWFYIDEASEIDDEDVPKMLSSRLRLINVPWRGGWFTTNPPHLEHWLHEWFIERGGADYFLVVASSYENPFLPPNYVTDLEKEYSPQWVRRFLLGEFGNITPGTAVYENWNGELHALPDITWMPDRPMIRAWDFGFHHPCVLYAQLGRDRALYFLREIMGDRILFHKFRDHVVTQSNLLYPGANFIDVGDPAGRQRGDKDDRTNADLLKEVHINLITRRYPKRRVIEVLDQRLAMIRRNKKTDEIIPMVQVSKKGCPILIEGFEGGYAWPKAREGRSYKETPMEDGYFEHVHDCAQYAASALFLGGSVVGDRLQIAEPKYHGI